MHATLWINSAFWLAWPQLFGPDQQILVAMSPVPYRARLTQIITAAGGCVEDERYVTRPGVLVMNVTAPTAEGAALLDAIGLDADLSPDARAAAFDARVTYLHFPEPGEDIRTGAAYLAEVLDVRGHTSVSARGFASVLFAGISLEASLELVANRSGRNARDPSSSSGSRPWGAMASTCAGYRIRCRSRRRRCARTPKLGCAVRRVARCSGSCGTPRSS